MDFAERRAIALDILTRGEGISRRAGSFCGQCVVDPTPLTEKQKDWFIGLAEKVGVVLGEVV